MPDAQSQSQEFYVQIVIARIFKSQIRVIIGTVEATNADIVFFDLYIS